MRITHDEQTDAMYIRLVDRPCECRNLRLSEEVTLDLGPGEVLVGIEILDAKRLVGNGQLPQLVVDPPPRGSGIDPASRVVIERLGIQWAFAFDDHFRQFGTLTVVP